MSLIKRIDIPHPYTIREFSYYHEATGKYYFELKTNIKRVYYHMSPILELDIEDLDGEFEWYKGPPVNITLKSAQGNQNHQEVWITMRDVSLDEAMVYGEMHTQDQAYYHGYQGPSFVSVHMTENFNGKVHFRYSGSDRPADEVREKLQLMEERFTKWAVNEAYACTDKSENVTLDAQYLEVSNNHKDSSKLTKDYDPNIPENKDTESNLMDYWYYLENGDVELFDDEKFLSEMHASCMNVLEKGESSLAHYLLGFFYMVNSDKDNAKKERLKAAYLGHCVAAIDYANQVGLEDNIEILGIFKAMNDEGEHLASMQEDIDYYTKKLSAENTRKVENIAEQVKLSIKEKGLKFTW
jgi:ribosomal protein S16